MEFIKNNSHIIRIIILIIILVLLSIAFFRTLSKCYTGTDIPKLDIVIKGAK